MFHVTRARAARKSPTLKLRSSRSQDHSVICWSPSDFVVRLRQLGPGVVTVVADAEILKIDVSEDGRLGINEAQDVELPDHLQHVMAESSTTAVMVRTFLPETTAVRHGIDNSRVVQVPIKELRAFKVFRTLRSGVTTLTWEQLSAVEARSAYDDTGAGLRGLRFADPT